MKTMSSLDDAKSLADLLTDQFRGDRWGRSSCARERGEATHVHAEDLTLALIDVLQTFSGYMVTGGDDKLKLLCDAVYRFDSAACSSRENHEHLSDYVYDHDH